MTHVRASSPLRDTLSLLRGESSTFLLALCLAAVAVMLELVPYVLLWQAAIAVDPANTLMTLAGWLLAALIGKYALLSLAGYFSHLTAFRVLYQTRLRLAQSLARIALLRLSPYSSASLRNIILNDVERVENFIAHHSVDLIGALLSPLIAALFLFWLDWPMALAALATVPLALLAQKIFSRGMAERTAQYHRASAELDSALVEYVRGVPVMKAFQQSSRAFRLLNQRLDAYHQLVVNFTRHAVPAWSAFVVILNANLFILLPIGLWRVAHGSLTIGTLLLVLILGSGLLKPLLRVTFLSSMLREIFSGVGRIMPLLDCPPPQPETALPVSNVLQTHQLSFGYDDTNVVKSVSLRFETGRFYALVGPSGAGKSTLAWLLAGLLPPSQGDITLGEVSVQKLHDATRAQRLALVSQEVFLLQGTLADNLRLGNPQASEAELWQALTLAQAENWVRSLPQGLHSTVGERGVTLSGGERQRIAIARALVAHTPILILDEATAFADALTEAAFYRALRLARPDTTLISIAHRLFAVQQADCIVMMAQGEVAAQGRHESLLASDMGYQMLWHSQFDLAHWHIRAEETNYVTD